MCGINGFNFSDRDAIQKMVAVTRHRGPDGEGIFVRDGISLGHNRLAIIDLSTLAAQPMESRDGHHRIVFNGEIYNYRELRTELIAKTGPFQTTSDTEVILRAYEAWGSGCFKRFNGIFALAIWDSERKELVLARDSVGVKPLFYYWANGSFIFSSELKGILTHEIPRTLDQTALALYFRLLYAPGEQTLLSGIKRLPPGHMGKLRGGTFEIKPYWSVSDFQDFDDKEGIKEEIRTLMGKAVRRQMIADVPVGLYLSGGIDSTVLLGLMAKESTRPIETFSVGFDVGEEEKKFNEDFVVARETAKRYRTHHHELTIGALDVAKNLEQMFWHMDDLVANPAQVANFLLSSLAGKHVKVVLGGDGGDELFGGYGRHYYYRLIERWQSLPRLLRNNVLTRAGFRALGIGRAIERLNTEDTFSLWWSFMAQKEYPARSVLKDDAESLRNGKEYMKKTFFENLPRTDLAKQMMYLDLTTWLPGASLIRSDQMGMASGLEERVPILDRDVVELAMRIPSRWKMRNPRQGKDIFREAMKEYIPEAVYGKKKTGWFLPTSKWLRTGLKDAAYEILSPDYNRATGEFIDFTAARIMLDDHITRRRYALNTIWSLIAFQVWAKKYLTDL
mgnify:CR=1 FL=1